jgi:hypothetical protein
MFGAPAKSHKPAIVVMLSNGRFGYERSAAAHLRATATAAERSHER